MGRRNNPPHPLIRDHGRRLLENFRIDVLLFYLRLTFLGGLGVKSAENRLTFLAPAFGALVLLFFPILYRKGKGILLAAILALELVVWHSHASFQIFLLCPPVSRRTPDLAIRLPQPENRLPIRILFLPASKTVDRWGF
jgi:hypothetical protein